MRHLKTQCMKSVFPFSTSLKLLNLFNYFATSIFKHAMQVVIITGILKFCAQVYHHIDAGT